MQARNAEGDNGFIDVVIVGAGVRLQATPQELLIHVREAKIDVS